MKRNDEIYINADQISAIHEFIRQSLYFQLMEHYTFLTHSVTSLSTLLSNFKEAKSILNTMHHNLHFVMNMTRCLCLHGMLTCQVLNFYASNN